LLLRIKKLLIGNGGLGMGDWALDRRGEGDKEKLIYYLLLLTPNYSPCPMPYALCPNP
jgi:hypothetical protein